MAITAQAQSEQRALITVSGLPANIGPWTVYRSDGMTETVVRGAVDRAYTADPQVIIDREAPLNRQVLYRLKYTDLTTLANITETTGWVTVAGTLPMLSEPISGQQQPVTVVQWPEITREARHEILAVSGRLNPVVITDTMGPAESQAVLRTPDAAGMLTVRQLLATGAALLLRSACLGVEDTYLSVARHTEARRSNKADDPTRLHTLNVVQIDMPNPAIATAADTLQMLADAEPGTLADINTRWPTLFDIATADLAESV